MGLIHPHSLGPHKLRPMTSEQHTDLSATPATGVVVPDRPALEGLEEKWASRWKDQGTYAFDRTQPRENVFS